MCALMITVSARFEERKILKPGQDVLNIRLRSDRARSCQIGLRTYYRKWVFFFLKKTDGPKFRLTCL